jgi:hypothetical protein
MNITKKSLVRRGIAAAWMFILLASTVIFAVANPLELESADAQVQDNCKKLAIRDILASGQFTAASNAVDKDPVTRWSHLGKGSFIKADLGQSAVLCSIDISWYHGNSRNYNFVISISNDGVHFNDIASAESTGKTDSAERYKVPLVTARYVKITVHGNNENDWAAINEMSVNGQVCSIPHVSTITANGDDDSNVPQNTLDNNLNTRWSNPGFPSWIQYDLGESQPICNVDIAWYRGNLRVNTFTISASNDGINFTPIFSGQSSGKTIGLERYDIPNVIAKYMRITVTGNTEISWSSITEVRINGGAILECNPPQIAGVSASGNQEPNRPQNTLDSSLNTRWSNFGIPSWIQYDLGESQPICNVDIAWYRGNLRVNTFTISASNDGINFTPIFSGQSSGKTIGLERYDVRDTMAEFLRITVVEPNTENSWSSMTEVRINGGVGTPPPSSPQEICGNGIDDDGDGQKDEDCPPSGGDSEKDPFGIRKIYPTKAGGEEWFMDMSDGKDPRSRPPSLSKNNDGSFKVTSTQVRYGVFTSDGYEPDEVELDHGTLAQRGYMQSPKDWKNVELTGYVKVNSGQSGENFAWYARGGRHTGSGSPEGCEGSAYKPDLYYDGRVRFSKEQWHVSYDVTDHKRPMGSIEDRWVGFKGIMWNMEQNGETVVKMEIWVDKNEDGRQDGPWVKVDENIDSGGWGSEGEECGGESDQIITWGGPIATFRWDGARDVDIKNFSVREIQPPT